MNTTTRYVEKIPKWFWVISILALLWFLMDMAGLVMRTSMLDEMFQDKPEAQKTFYLNIPSWVNIVFAFEVAGGIIGSIGLLLRKKWALIGFAISLLGTFGQTFYLYFLSDAIQVSGVSAIIMPLVAITLCIGLIVFTRSMIDKNWLQ